MPLCSIMEVSLEVYIWSMQLVVPFSMFYLPCIILFVLRPDPLRDEPRWGEWDEELDYAWVL